MNRDFQRYRFARIEAHNVTRALFKQPNSNILWLKYSRHGRPVRESSGTSDEKKAAKILKILLAEVATGTFQGLEVERIRIDELAEDFLRDFRVNGCTSIADAEARWRIHLTPFFGTMRAIHLTSDQIARYVDQRQQEQAANATINRELAALKRMFKLGYKATPPKVRHMPAFPHLQENNVRKGFLDSEQHDRLAVECTRIGLWMRALLEVGCAFGWRVNELLSLRVRQVDLDNRILRLDPGTTKNGEGRAAVMPSAVFFLIAQCVAGKQPDDFVFTREDGKPVKIFRRTWANLTAAAGVPELLFHDLRRTAVRNMTRRGIPERVAMQISGHKTRSIFDRYHITNEQDLRDAARRMEEPEIGIVWS